MSYDAAVAIVIALQFAAFGWRINREISVGDEGRKTWLPIADYINIAMILLTSAICIVLPLASGEFVKASKIILAIAVVFIAFHPISIAGHYCLLVGQGRDKYISKKGLNDYPYFTDEEIISLIISAILAISAAVFIFLSP